MTTAVGWERHRDGVARLLASFAAIPAGTPARVWKRAPSSFQARVITHAPGLDMSLLGRVIEIDPIGLTADVQGACSYRRLAAATMAQGLVPRAVPTPASALAGGSLAHTSVIEADVLTGSGDIVTARRGDDLFETFRRSGGSLGPVTRLRIELEPRTPSTRVPPPRRPAW